MSNPFNRCSKFAIVSNVYVQEVSDKNWFKIDKSDWNTGKESMFWNVVKQFESEWSDEWAVRRAATSDSDQSPVESVAPNSKMAAKTIVLSPCPSDKCPGSLSLLPQYDHNSPVANQLVCAGRLGRSGSSALRKTWPKCSAVTCARLRTDSLTQQRREKKRPFSGTPLRNVWHFESSLWWTVKSERHSHQWRVRGSGEWCERSTVADVLSEWLAANQLLIWLATALYAMFCSHFCDFAQTLCLSMSDCNWV